MKFVEPITVKEIEKEKFVFNGKPLFGGNIGDLVAIRPCAEEYKNKTYLGFLLGNVAISIIPDYDRKEEKITLNSYRNPGIFVPELKKIIYGMESWWGVIKTEDDFKQITDQDIENTWYVKLWKEMQKDSESKNA